MPEIRCPACGALNRIPADRVGAAARCGKCKAALQTAAPVHVTDATFESVVAGAGAPVLLDCWADWCGPCHALAPTIDALARDYAGRVIVGKLDVDANPATAARFEVRGIPTLLLLRDGREVDRIVGVQPKSEIARRLERAIS